MNICVDKQRVKESFSIGARTYDRNAEAQLKIVRNFLGLLKSRVSPDDFRCTMEFGCGTGFLTKRIISEYSPQSFYLNDLVEFCVNELEKLYPVITPMSGDAECLDLPNGLSSAVSASTVQWFDDFQGFTEKIHKALVPNGLFAFTSFGPGNFTEIRSLSGKGLNYLSEDRVCKILEEKGFEVLHSSAETLMYEFESPVAVLRHMKYTGVNATASKRSGSTGIGPFRQNYIKQYPYGQGVALTFNPLYFIARKREK
ncbi:hypothetical protein FUAX_20220 [Fulvitalea axinellae]|uniref:Methyltransferase domain-containing protein n=1 Tax=Fulvitalea axinellae TaxID=1182444 RepID=A0AAU9CJS6_9BACT|nr:hypothetical protein FUAX_20220 [Fulvitalea axinellae]